MGNTSFILASIGVFLVVILLLVIILLVAKKYLSPSGNFFKQKTAYEIVM